MSKYKSIALEGYPIPGGTVPADSFAYPITVTKVGVDNFTVTYGKQVNSGLSYGAACDRLGSAIMHALSCDGVLDAE